jgi:hypothetical protein
MNPAKIFSLVKRMAFAVLVGMVVVGCTPQETYQVTSVILEDNPEAKSMKGGAPSAKSAPLDVEEKYAATLEVTENIKLGNTGTVKVWVGWLKYMQKANAGMARDTTMLYTSGKYARITPSAEGCIIDKEQDIIPIDPAGSEAKFIITPQKADEIEVSAEIEMFDNEDCLGLPSRKNSTQVLHVKVKVDYWGEIWDPVWKYFKPFWISFVALFFGALLFVIRKFIKKKTGYSDEIDKKSIEEKIGLPKTSSQALEEGDVEMTEVVDEMPNEEETENADNEAQEAEGENRPADE